MNAPGLVALVAAALVSSSALGRAPAAPSPGGMPDGGRSPTEAHGRAAPLDLAAADAYAEADADADEPERLPTSTAAARRSDETAAAGAEESDADAAADPAAAAAEAPPAAPADEAAAVIDETAAVAQEIGPVAAHATKATAAEEITVTATGLPTRLADSPAPVTVLGAAELAAAPAATLDDVLRQVPGFTLFRRSGSRTANPTAQGSSLRGLGGSAATRALVLADGVPLADPFGGWVHWGRLPRLALERVEVLRGGASGLYGTGALAGVVQLLRRPAGADAVLAEGTGGGQGTAGAGVFAAGAHGGWQVAGHAEAFASDGYVPVAAAERGPVDTAAGAEHTTAELTLARPTGGGRWFVRGGAFAEERENGTPLQDNATDLAEVALGGDARLAGGDAAARLWWTDVRYRQAFTAVAADRASERLTRLQDVPSDALGASGTWTAGSGRHTWLAGVEGRRTRGESRETGFPVPGRIVHETAGGEQRTTAAWVEDVAALAPGWSAALAVRWDRWRNEPLAFTPAAAAGTRVESAWSPRLSVRWQAAPAWALTAAAYRAFRAPTLNELYRGFRVGDVTTDPNPTLGPERLAGVDLGAAWQPGGAGAWRLRGNLFWMELEDGVANVTVASGPGGIRRRRENVGLTRSRGVELEVDGELGRRLAVTGGLQLVDAEVVDFPADPSLEGRRVAQVPDRQASLGLDWRGDVVAATLLGRWSSDAWDDDRNALALGEQLVLDARVERPLAAGAAVFAAVENLLDEEYAVGRTPVTTVGSPRLVRLGVRYRWPGR